MSRNDCEAVIQLHRAYRPRRRTGRGFLTGTVFLDASLLLIAFVLATSPFVKKPGILLDLPRTGEAGGIRATDLVLSICNDGLYFLNDQQVAPEHLLEDLQFARKIHPDAALVLEADQSLSQSATLAVYNDAAKAGFLQIFIATRPTP